MSGLSLYTKDKEKERERDNLNAESEKEEERQARGRSSSPFQRKGRRRRSISAEPPAPLKLSQSEVEAEDEGIRSTPINAVRPRNMAYSYGSDEEDDSGSGSEEEWDSDDGFDAETSHNTELNAAVASPIGPDEDSMLELPDPLGEGVNVVMAPELFPGQRTGINSPRRRKASMRDPLPLVTSRPMFAKDRCTVVLTHGDPDAYLAKGERVPRKYMVASDLSEESKYAVEWGIGTVLRDGDEMILVNVTESETKVDADATDRVAKLRNQQERSTLAYLLVRQATSLLQRTRLHVTVSCQAWHARNSRHMLLDLIDFYEPTMVIVGSRGLGQLKGILLGSTSHYLIQKSSVPVMVARRRMKRPAKRTAHLLQRARVPLSQAAIDKEGPGKLSTEVERMREEVELQEREEVAARERVGVKIAGE
ncbi:adenine nucleotide alpha hydrolases-like protein [Dacryopinax primogenitus]|uniref:Adenine nucleotide alpha hydrolases-like protein n=1 Tax=Dacryopinax primogenitus (strain DJM 731) TaxID=1858805 RepID=M5FYT4_DACPD|nr:adenine nucleotide alpha hydrolases-like protein [Dacryopinax primogenitus]EJT98716.1 adenine nucleotide alpha hydrolases-like protein [Dacryopinax primogenitus]